MRNIHSIVICSLLLLLLSCHQKKEESSNIQLVEIATVQKNNLNTTLSFPGKINTPNDVNLSFRVAGMIKTVNVSSGQSVRKGDILARLDNTIYLQQYNAAKAKYHAVKQEADRVIKLYATKSTSPNQYEQAISAINEAKAVYTIRYNELQYTILRAPYDGFIQKKYFNNNEIVNAGTPVLSMTNHNNLEIITFIPSGEYINQDNFINYSCIPDIYPNKVIPLDLLEINHQANYNQLFKLRLSIAPQDSIILVSGMSVAVTIECKESVNSEMSIPISAIFRKGDKSYVWQYNADNETITPVEITIKEVQKSGHAIILCCLHVGDKIVAVGSNSLTDGEKVKLLPPPEPGNVGDLL